MLFPPFLMDPSSIPPRRSTPAQKLVVAPLQSSSQPDEPASLQQQQPPHQYRYGGLVKAQYHQGPLRHEVGCRWPRGK